MHLTITTPESVLYDDEIDAVSVPTTTGRITVLPHHISLLTQVDSGEVTVRRHGKEEFIGVTGGFLEVKKEVVTLLSDYAVHSESIVVEKAIAAQKRAEEILQKSEGKLTDEEIASAQATFNRALMELKVASRRKSR